MAFLHQLFDTLIHLSPDKVNDLAHAAGPWLYVLLFGIIFAETGLVITPFLPGDSLLFAVGAVAAHPDSPVNVWWLAVLLVVAAVLGDAVNYAIGYRVGPRVFSREDSRLLNRKHLVEAQRFYDKYGGKTIILARFVPIVRTFAPFVAGIGRMTYARFAAFNVIGGVVWVTSFLLAGWWFGQQEVVKRYFHLVIVAIIAISVAPALWEIVRARRAARLGHSEILEATTLGEDPAAAVESTP